MLTVAIAQLSRCVDPVNIAQRLWVRHQLSTSCHWAQHFFAIRKCLVMCFRDVIASALSGDKAWMIGLPSDTFYCGILVFILHVSYLSSSLQSTPSRTPLLSSHCTSQTHGASLPSSPHRILHQFSSTPAYPFLCSVFQITRQFQQPWNYILPCFLLSDHSPV